jgi:hypothetical protein
MLRLSSFAAGQGFLAGLGFLLLSGGAAAQSAEEGSPSGGDSPAIPEGAAESSATASAGGEATLSGGAAQTDGAAGADATASSGEFVVEGFGNAYNFDGEGRVLGIKGGSLAGTGHGFQLNWPKTGLLFSGNTWLDTGYRAAKNEILNDEAKFVQEGRVMLRFTPTYTYGKWFARAQAEFLAHAKFPVQNSYIDTDDAWIAVGYKDVFDVQVGRYEAWEVYHKGLGLERDTLEDIGAQGGEDIYEVNNVFYRESSFGQLALHGYIGNVLRLEVNSVLGYQGGDGAVGVRPAVIADFGFLKLKAAAEYKLQKPTQEDPNNKRKAEFYGLGGSVQGILWQYAELGVNGAYGVVDRWNQLGDVDLAGSTETLSLGGFLNFNFGTFSPALDRLVIGGGANLTTRNNRSCVGPNTPMLDAAGNPVGELQPDGVTVVPLFLPETCGSNTHLQAYGAIQYSLFDHVLLKAVFGMADAELVPGPDEAFIAQHNSMWNARLRLLIWY